MSDYHTKLPSGVQLRFSREAAVAAARLLDDQDHYPGLKFSGNKESYEKLRADIELVAQEYADLFLAGTKHLRDGIMN